MTVVLAVVVALILVLSFLALGSPPSSGGSKGVPFSTAKSAGTVIVSSAGAGWELLDAIGFDLPNATTEPLGLSGLPNCTITSLAGPLPDSLTIPRFTGNLTSGNASTWDLAYVQPTTNAEIALAVTDGSVTVAIELSGPHCLPVNLSADESIPANVVDSTVAASAAAAAGATAFVASHPTGVSLEVDLFPFNFEEPDQPSLGDAAWVFDYSTCPVLFGSTNATEPPGATFQVTVNASSGAVVPGSAFNGTCGSSTTPPLGIGNALGFGIPVSQRGATGATLEGQGCTSGDYCYSLPVVLATDNVTPSDLEEALLELNGSGFGTPYAAVGYAIVNSEGQVVVYSEGSVELNWSNGVGTAETPISTQMTFWVDTGTAPPPSSGLDFYLTGVGPFSGSGEGIILG